jgi:hypothetical protein
VYTLDIGENGYASGSKDGCVRLWDPDFKSITSVNISNRRGVLDTTLCDKVCQLLVAGWWFSPGTPVSSTNKTDEYTSP